jgi:hypothetical protein
MAKFTLFEILVVAHLIIDFIFQRQWEAKRKNKTWLALALHCLIYTIGFIPVFWFLKISFWWLFLLFISHFIIDNQRITRWILEDLKGYKQGKTREPFWTLLFIGVDQTFHLLILLIIAILV